jgi:undecaprenyl-diphosphatase
VGNVDIAPILIGMICAGISGYFAIKLLVKFVMNGKLYYFSYYVFILGIAVLIDQLFLGKVF